MKKFLKEEILERRNYIYTLQQAISLLSEADDKSFKRWKTSQLKEKK